MAGSELAFTILAKDINAERTFKKVGSAAAKAGKDMNSFTKFAKAAGKGLLTFSKYGVIAASVVSLVGDAFEALGPATAFVGAGLASLPSLALLAAGALVTLKLALHGVGEAIGAGLSGDAGKFNEALQKLAPAAQEFAKAVVALKPQLTDLRSSVQQHFFVGMAEEIKGLAAVYLPMLKARLSEVADGFNAGFKQSAGLAKTKAFTTDIDFALGNVATALGTIAQAFAPLLSVFAKLAATSSGFLPQMAAGFTAMAGRFADFISTAAGTGQLQAFFASALDFGKQLFGLLSQAVSVLDMFGRAAAAGGNSLFNTLGKVLDALGAILSSSEGFNVIVGIFQAANAVISALLPILSTLIVSLGPGVSALLNGFAGALTALAPAAKPVGDAITAVAQAIAPLLPVVGQLLSTLLVPLANVITQLVVAAEPLYAVFAAVAQVLLTELGKALDQLVSSGAMDAIIQAVTEIFNAFIPLLPVITQVGIVILDSLMAILPGLLAMLKPILPVIVQLAQAISAILIKVLDALKPYLPQLMQALGQLAGAFLQIIVALLPILPPLMKLIMLLVDAVLKSGALDVIIKIITVTIKLLSGVFRAIAVVIETVIGWVRSAWEWFGKLKDKIGGALDILGTVKDKVVGAFKGAVAWLLDAGKDILKGLTDGIKWVIDNALAVGEWVWNKVVDAFAGAGAWLFDTGKSILQGVADGIWWIINNALAVGTWVWGKVVDAFNGAGTWLFNAGLKIITGLVDGINVGVNNYLIPTLQAVGGMIPQIKGPPAKDRKMLVPAGQLIMAGLRTGIDSGVPPLRAQLAQITAQIPTMTAPARSSGSALPAGHAHVVIDVTGADADLKRLVRKWVRVDGGGSVQAAFGR